MHDRAPETGEIAAGVAGACVVAGLAAIVVPSARWPVGVAVAAVVFVEVLRARQPAGPLPPPPRVPTGPDPWRADVATFAHADVATVSPAGTAVAAAADVPTVAPLDAQPEPVDLWAYLEHRSDPWAEAQCPSCGSADIDPTDVCRSCGTVVEPGGFEVADVFIDPRSVRSTHPT